MTIIYLISATKLVPFEKGILIVTVLMDIAILALAGTVFITG